jgi:hypothetical protein
MEILIKIWFCLGYLTYGVFWLGSVSLFNVSCAKGILIGAVAWIIHVIILQILYWINGDKWVWNP